ncbi:hypothetical protein TW83_00210 [Paracoccus sp. S4493]|uniref:hypothetical protein n=1 Tax=Paracoccus sp. S4493 TaxID=579490 RepID=UPI0005FA29AE|nr:hypothetical protein [Paracoccus sp. S4493]KJZ33003.1 hypothetical protein TW83_00210 [Paracoccus sp. S4493]
MRRVDFTLDGSGPYAGMMCFGQIGKGEIEFINILLPRDPMTAFQTVRVMVEGDETFDAPIRELVLIDDGDEPSADHSSGYITFETV